jgi:hypothetical protein
MPPQQFDRLLDLLDEFFTFRAHFDRTTETDYRYRMKNVTAIE